MANLETFRDWIFSRKNTLSTFRNDCVSISFHRDPKLELLKVASNPGRLFFGCIFCWVMKNPTPNRDSQVTMAPHGLLPTRPPHEVPTFEAHLLYLGSWPETNQWLITMVSFFVSPLFRIGLWLSPFQMAFKFMAKKMGGTDIYIRYLGFFLKYPPTCWLVTTRMTTYIFSFRKSRSLNWHHLPGLHPGWGGVSKVYSCWNRMKVGWNVNQNRPRLMIYLQSY